MNNKTNYTLVGLMVVTGIVILLAFSYWMLKPSDEAKERTYIIYFTESVFGLNLNAPVKFRGINVGRVTKMRINPKNSEEVEVRVSILADTPIENNIVAKLTAQGITGLTYINLTAGEAKKIEKVKINGEMCRVIPTAPSFFKHFEQSFGSMSDRMTAALYQAEKLLNDENQKELMRLVRASANSMEKVDRVLDEKTITHLHNTVRNLDETTAHLNHTLTKIDTTLDYTKHWEDNLQENFGEIMISYKHMEGTLRAFEDALDRGDFNIREITSEMVPTLTTTLIELQKVLIRFDQSLQGLQKSPSDILYKRQEVKKGPGE